MSWYKSSQFENQLKDLNQLESQANICIQILSSLDDLFPNAHFMCTAEDIGNLVRNGPKISFFVMWQEIKDKIDKVSIYFEDREKPIISNGVEIKGYIQRSGFDFFEHGEFKQQVPNLYRYSDGGFIPAEKTEDIITLGIFGGSAKNAIYKIQYNTFRKINQSKVDIKYMNNESINNAIARIREENMDKDEAMDFFKQVIDALKVSDFDKFYLENSFKEWYWTQMRTREEFMQSLEGSLEKNMEEAIGEEDNKDGRDPYVFYPDMNPHKEGRGKYVINISDLEPAFQEWGDFNILVRYQTGRMNYPASKIIGWDKADIDDDQAYNFKNQMGGIRDMSILG